MVHLYNLGIGLMRIFIQLAGLLGNKKAALLHQGQKTAIPVIAQYFKDNKYPVIWMHCSSVGEFEQGRPVLEALRLQHPTYKILLTFFSSSGYNTFKNTPLAHCVAYLPLDSKRNAKALIAAVQPIFVLWVKYEYWFNMLNTLKQNNIPAYLFSAIFDSKQIFFKWYGCLFRKILKSFTLIFVQNEHSVALLNQIGIVSVELMNDTRFDRVITIAQQSISYPLIAQYIQESPCLILGSSWPKDEKIIQQALQFCPAIKLIIVPHELDEHHLKSIEHLFPSSVRYTQLASKTPTQLNQVLQLNCLIVDTMGMLSSLYSYADIAYIGCGFDDGIHNILEPAVWGIPILFGPNYQQFNEAIDLIELGGVFSITKVTDLAEHINRFLDLKSEIERCGAINKKYVNDHAGASIQIARLIAKLELLN